MRLLGAGIFVAVGRKNERHLGFTGVFPDVAPETICTSRADGICFQEELPCTTASDISERYDVAVFFLVVQGYADVVCPVVNGWVFNWKPSALPLMRVDPAMIAP